MYITNIWGMCFCFMLPTILMVFGAYIEGIEDGKKMKHKKKRGAN